MKFLLTSSGISNTSIHNALVELLGKPITESSALIIPTAIYPFPGGAGMAWRAICGVAKSPLCGLGWKSLGVLELTALPSIDGEAWIPMIQETDALLVWGGDPLYLSHWMRQSGLADLLPSLRREMVYVGVSAGSMATAATFGETYLDPPRGSGEAVTSEDIVFATPQGDISRILVTAQGVGLVDFALIPHLDHEDHPDASLASAEQWAARLQVQVPVPMYAIDDQTAIKVVDGAVEVISEGHWKLFVS
ncbi:MAG: Alpha-aspartyl dipeptidase Peptidase E [Ktedonobacterales bacterium]|jgi:dipeptidase E|nr:MAG: Alpha-aspartyl dipeptidase Peptidase E [Ktedonobacterales bacterium]